MTDVAEDPPFVNPNGSYNITKADGSVCPEKQARYIALMVDAGFTVSMVGPKGRIVQVTPRHQSAFCALCDKDPEQCECP